MAIAALAGIGGCDAGRTGDGGAVGLEPAPRIDLANAPAKLPSITPAPETDVILLDPGESPRRPLRYRPALGDEQKLTVIATMDLALDTDGHRMFGRTLENRLVVRFRVEAISDRGDIDVSFEILESEQTNIAPGSPAGGLQSLEGASGSFVADDRGGILASDLAALAERGIAGAFFVLSNYIVELPEEPIGQGARWEIQSSQSQQGMTVPIVESLQLVELDGDRGRVRGEITHANQPQIMTSAELAPDSVMEVISSESAGETAAAFSRARLISPRTLSYESNASMQLRTPGLEQDVTMVTSVTTRIDDEYVRAR